MRKESKIGRRIVTIILLAAMLTQPLVVLAEESSGSGNTVARKTVAKSIKANTGSASTTENAITENAGNGNTEGNVGEQENASEQTKDDGQGSDGQSKEKTKADSKAEKKYSKKVSHVQKKGKYYYYYDAKTKKIRRKEGFVKWEGSYYFVRKGGKILTNAGVVKDNKPYFAGKDGAMEKVTLRLPDNPKRSKIVKKARKQVGIMTGAKYWIWYFGSRFVDTDRTPWCGTFVAWVFKKTGLYSKIKKVKRYGNLGYVPSYSAFAGRNKKWIKRSKAAPGDIVIFGKRRGTHIGIVEGLHKGYVYTIEGNSGPTAKVGCKKPGACTRQAYKLSTKRIKGVMRVL